MRDAADIVGTERGGDDRLVFEQDSRKGLEVYVALRLLKINRTIPAVLPGFNLFVIPIRAFDEPDGETRPARATPLDQIAQIGFGIAQIGLSNDASMGPIVEFGFGAECFEKVERGVFMRITFHVEVDKRAQLARAAQNRPQLRREMGNGVGRIGRIHLRIERGNFYREIYNWKKLGVCSERIGPAACVAREMFE